MKIVIAIILVVITVVGFWMWKYPSGSWRYRMTVTVETPEGIKTGSAVRKVRMQITPQLLPDMHGAQIVVKGEAIVIDLGKRGVLFGLLKSRKTVDYGYMVFLDMFPLPGKTNASGGGTPEGIRYHNQQKSGLVELPSDELPEFVHFRDLKDPKTVELVDPTNMAASFGEGVKLVGAKIEITDEPGTTGIEKWLPWLRSHRKGYLDGQFAGGGPELSNILHLGDFQKGTYK